MLLCRNRLRKDRAEKLVSIFSNTRLLRKNQNIFWESMLVQEDESFTSDEEEDEEGGEQADDREELEEGEGEEDEQECAGNIWCNCRRCIVVERNAD